MCVCVSVYLSAPPLYALYAASPGWGQCVFAVACPLPIRDPVLIVAGATFGWAVLEQQQLLERAPKEKARRERKQQGSTVFSVNVQGIGRASVVAVWKRSVLEAGLSRLLMWNVVCYSFHRPHQFLGVTCAASVSCMQTILSPA